MLRHGGAHSEDRGASARSASVLPLPLEAVAQPTVAAVDEYDQDDGHAEEDLRVAGAESQSAEDGRQLGEYQGSEHRAQEVTVGAA